MYNLYLSHSWFEPMYYERLKMLLESEKSFSYIEHSSESENPERLTNHPNEMKIAIAIHMQPVDAVLILADDYATYSDWIDAEIAIAKNQFAIPRPIIAVHTGSIERVPKAIREAADEIVSWRSANLVYAIKEFAPKRRCA